MLVVDRIDHRTDNRDPAENPADGKRDVHSGSAVAVLVLVVVVFEAGGWALETGSGGERDQLETSGD